MKPAHRFRLRADVEMPKQVVHFVSANPGIGKTYGIVKAIAKFLRKPDPKGYVIYVAPSTLLCDEIAKNIRKAIGSKMDRDDLDARLHMVHHQNKGDTSQVREAVGKLVRTKFPIGSVLIITHPTFYVLSERLYPSALKRRTTVYFDEVHKSITQGAKLSLSAEGKEALGSLFSSSQAFSSGEFKRLSLVEGASGLKKATEKMSVRKHIQDINTLIEEVANPNIEVYTYTTRKGTGASVEAQTYKVIVPARVFVGYKKAYITSAFFYDSQMYHLLRLDPDVRLVDETENFIPNYSKQLMAAQEQYRHITIIPLTRAEHAMSQSHLDKDVLVTRKLGNKIAAYVTKEKFSKAERLDLVKLLRGINTDASKRVKKLKDKLETNDDLAVRPMEWYAEAASELLYHLGDKAQYPIVFVKKNKGYENLFDYKEWASIKTDEARGSNGFISSTLGAYLKPLNPPPNLKRFLQARLEDDYKVDADWSVASCIQCLMRTAIRNEKNKDTVYFVVGDMETALTVQSKLGPAVKIAQDYSYGFGSFGSLLQVMNSVKVKETKIARDEVRKEWHKKRSAARSKDPIASSINRLSAKRSYLRKKLIQAPNSHDLANQIKAITNEIDTLRGS